MKAAPPRVPGPLEDDSDLAKELAALVRTKKPSRKTSAHKSGESAPPAAVSSAAPPTLPPRPRFPPARPSPPPSALDKLPIEIRYIIFKELLNISKPIKVHSGWKQVYKRQRFSIPIDILVTCRRFYDEGTDVLYGCNTFLYRLRDKIPSITDVDQVAFIDDRDAVLPTTTNSDEDQGEEDEDPEPEDTNDPDWREETVVAPRQYMRRSRRVKPVPLAEPDIHVEKHLHQFRELVIEAEKNRFAQGTKKLMANAIETFSYLKSPHRTNIRTLTIRVAPQWDATGGTDGYGCFTFVDFFNPQSAVVQAIKSVNSQVVKV